MSKTIRWGILGLGGIAKTFVEGVSILDDAEVVACGSRTADKAEAFGAKLNIPHRHASYEALVADPDVDAIYVATPHPMHKENCLLAIANGKPVLCEKPFTMNVRETEEVIAAAKAANLLVMDGMWSLFLPHVLKAHELAKSGIIGDVRMIQADFAFRGGWQPEARWLNPVLGGGALLDVGVYVISLAQLFLGQPTTITGTAHIGDTGVDEQAAIVLGLPEGKLASLFCGVRIKTNHEATIFGTEGSIKLHKMWYHPSKLTLSINKKEEKEIAPDTVGNGFNYEAAEFGRCLRDGIKESPMRTYPETISVMNTMDTLRKQWGLVYPMEGAEK